MIKKIKLIKIDIDIDRIETEETPTSWENAFCDRVGNQINAIDYTEGE